MKDMTKGSPIRLILGFAIPLFFGMLFQQFYNLVDMIIVGRFLGASALAAVGATGSINFMIIGFCMGVCKSIAHSHTETDNHKIYRFLYGSVQWICHPGCTEIRSQR